MLATVVGRVDDDLDLAREQDTTTGAGIGLVEDDGVLGQVTLAGDAEQGLQFIGVEIGEEGTFPEEAREVAHPIRHRP